MHIRTLGLMLTIAFTGCNADNQSSEDASEAYRPFEEFKFLTNCKRIALIAVAVEPNDLGVEQSSIRNAVKSRLRSANLFTTELVPFQPHISIQLEFSRKKYPLVMVANVAFSKPLEDPISGHMMTAQTWGQRAFGAVYSAEATIGAIHRILDTFITEYLRVNEPTCKAAKFGP